jgi:mannan endo-1,4-beta-mannosidase
MLDHAPEVAAADELKNTVFSVHMYGVYSTADSVKNYVNQFLTEDKLPLVIGEFAADDPSDGKKLPAKAVMKISEEKGLGYMGWSWAGNSGAAYSKLIDLTNNFELNNLSDWGDLLINDTNGLKATAKPATVFDSSNQGDDNGDHDDNGGDNNGGDNHDGDNNGGNTPGGDTDTSVTCDVTTSSQWSGGYVLDVKVTNNGAAIDGWKVSLNYDSAPTLVNFWNADLTADGQMIQAVNTSWNGKLETGKTVSFGVQGAFEGTYKVPTCEVL